jgi:tRNA(fMet)-specific endonuclease VapC
VVRFFLDTNACVGLLRGTSLRLRQRLLERSPDEVAIPAVVAAELLFGARKSAAQGNLEKTRRFLSNFDIVPFDAAAAEQYGSLRADLEQAGTVIGPNDLMIAATVLAAGGVLVTHNTKEFARVAKLPTEDWQ